MKIKLTNIDVNEIAFCKVPAVPRATFAVKKSGDGTNIVEFNQDVPLFKSEIKKQVFMPILVPDEVDKQDHVVSKEDVEKAAHSYMKNLSLRLQKGNGTSDTHKDFNSDYGHPIESVIDHDGSIAKFYNSDAPAGSWWIGFQMNDDGWDKVEKGEFNGGSIGGVGKYTPLEKSVGPLDLDNEITVKKIADAVAEKISKVFTKKIEKEGGAKTFNEAFVERENEEKLWDITGAFHRSLNSILSDDEVDNKYELVKKTLQQFATRLLAYVEAVISTDDNAEEELELSAMKEIEKIFEEGSKKLINKSIGGTEMALTKEELAEITKSVGDGVNASLTDALKKNNDELKTYMDENFVKKSEGDSDTDTDLGDKNVIKDGIVKVGDKEINLAELVDTVNKIAKSPNSPNSDKVEGDQPDGKDINGTIEKTDADKISFGQSLLGTKKS